MKKIEYLNFGFDVESAEIKHLYEQSKLEILKLKFEIEELKSNNADDFFKNLINLANEHEDVRFKLENFYKINKQIYQKNEQRNL
jgi:predicted transcriptional regulator